MNIPMPTEAEKKKSIEYIRKTGLEKRKNIFGVILELCKNVGLKNIFFDVGDCLLLAFVAVAAAFCLTYVSNSDYVNVTVIITAPAFFLTACLLSSWKDYMSGTTDQKAVCKYRTSYISAFRMLTFSAVGIILDIPFCMVLSRLLNTEFFKILLFSLSSMLLYSLVMTASLLTVKFKYIEYAVPAVWLAVNLIPYLKIEKWAVFINGLSNWVPLVFCVVFTLLYIILLNLLIYKGEKKYADS